MAYAQKKTLKGGRTRWYARYLGGDGKYHVEGGFASEREALKVAHLREEEAHRGEWIDPASSRMTFAHYVERFYWPTTTNLEVSTRAAYRTYLGKHFFPTFGHLPMRRITASGVQAWVNAATGPLKPRTVVKYHALLHSIFDRAVGDRVVPHNPCARTALPKVVTAPRRVLSPPEFEAIMSNLDPRYRTLALLEIETGLRWGELVALRACDIDFAARTVRVHRTLIEVSKKDSPTGARISVKDYPKDNEPRSVQIEGSTCTLIRSHMMSSGLRDHDLLFTGSTGAPISRNNFRTKYWLPALRDAGLEGHATFHSLRAAHASWLLAGGADLQVVKERLGHKQIATTQQYLGTMPDAGEQALAAFKRTRQRLG